MQMDSNNPRPSKEDLPRVRWHDDCDQEAISSWHEVANLTFTSCSSEGHLHQSNKISNKS